MIMHSASLLELHLPKGEPRVVLKVAPQAHSESAQIAFTLAWLALSVSESNGVICALTEGWGELKNGLDKVRAALSAPHTAHGTAFSSPLRSALVDRGTLALAGIYFSLKQRALMDELRMRVCPTPALRRAVRMTSLRTHSGIMIPEHPSEAHSLPERSTRARGNLTCHLMQ